MLIRKLFNKWVLICLFVDLIGGIGIMFAREAVSNPGEKRSWNLVEDDRHAGIIDEETAFMYKFYCINDPDSLPQKYKKPNMRLYQKKNSTLDIQRELENIWNKLSEVNKKKIKIITWKNRLNFYSEQSSIVKIIEPKDSEVVDSSNIVIKGTIETPEVYNVTNAWIKIGDVSITEKQKIKLSKVEHILPEEIYQEKMYGKERGRKYYLEFKEQFKDKPGLVELYGPPGQNIYNFSETGVLPSTGIWNVSIGAENEGSKFAMQEDFDSVWIVYPPKAKTDITPPTIEIEGVEDGQKFDEIPYEEYVKGKIYGSIKFIYGDSSPTLLCTYSNNKRISFGSPYNFTTSFRKKVYSLDDIKPYLQKEGVNKVKVVATDCYGNTSTKEINIILIKKKQ
ncbi:MAG: hypothetical protein PHE88_04775 [Elusimicrobia bacterium]|nr:hypothetical protein [Elusimicrobiota bacterium]